MYGELVPRQWHALPFFIRPARKTGSYAAKGLARGLPFKLRDISLKDHLEFVCEVSIFFTVQVLLDQSQSQPSAFEQFQ